MSQYIQEYDTREVVFADDNYPDKKTVILGDVAVDEFAERYMMEYKRNKQGKFVKVDKATNNEKYNRSPIILAEVLGNISRNNIHLWKQCIRENKNIKVRRSTAEALALEFNRSIKLFREDQVQGATKYVAHFFSYIYDNQQLQREWFYSELDYLRSDPKYKNDEWDPRTGVSNLLEDMVPGYRNDSTHYRSEVERKYIDFKKGVLGEWMKRKRGGYFKFDYEVLPIDEYNAHLKKPRLISNPDEFRKISTDLYSQDLITEEEFSKDMKQLWDERQSMKHAADAYCKKLLTSVPNIEQPIPVINPHDLDDFSVVSSDAFKLSKFHYKLDKDVSKNLPVTLFGMSIDEDMAIEGFIEDYEENNILICDHHYVPKNDEHLVVKFGKIHTSSTSKGGKMTIPVAKIVIGQLMAPKEFWSIVQESQAKGEEHMDWSHIYLHRWRIKDDVDFTKMFDDGWSLQWMFPIKAAVHGL